MENKTVKIRDAGADKFVVSSDDAQLVVDSSDYGFRPTELIMAALGACTAGTIQAFALANKVPGFEGVDVNVSCETAVRPSRIERFHVEIIFRGTVSHEHADQLARVGKHCKIHNTLHRDPNVTVTTVLDEARL
jgi:uncharacterized OsmC-like protein